MDCGQSLPIDAEGAWIDAALTLLNHVWVEVNSIDNDRQMPLFSVLAAVGFRLFNLGYTWRFLQAAGLLILERVDKVRPIGLGRRPVLWGRQLILSYDQDMSYPFNTGKERILVRRDKALLLFEAFDPSDP